MAHSHSKEIGSPNKKGKNPLPDWATGLLIAEAVALAIALVTPVTPSKTGSKWSPANLFVADPTYLENVAASFVMVNILLLLLGLVVWGTTRYGGSG